jgi:hypothetical protein
MAALSRPETMKSPVRAARIGAVVPLAAPVSGP